MSKIAFIGDRDSVLGLRALGVVAVPVSTPDEARAGFGAAVTGGYAIIFVTEDMYEACADQIAELRDQALPTVTVLLSPPCTPSRRYPPPQSWTFLR